MATEATTKAAILRTSWLTGRRCRCQQRRTDMLLEDKNAVIYGGGVIGGAVARAFAREGATVHPLLRERCMARRILMVL